MMGIGKFYGIFAQQILFNPFYLWCEFCNKTTINQQLYFSNLGFAQTLLSKQLKLGNNRYPNLFLVQILCYFAIAIQQIN